MKLFVDDASFYKKLISIAIPIALQNIITVGVSMMDTLMLGRLGEVQLSAASIANQWFFMLMVLNFGLAGGANVLIAQYWGKHDTIQIRKIMSFVYKLSVILSVLFAAAALLAPEFIMSIFTPDIRVIESGAKYLRVIGWVYPFYALANNSILMMRAIGTVKISLVVYSTSFVVNVFLNWVLIYGNLGAPRLEIAGAAIATAAARFCEFIIVVAFMFKFEKNILFKLKDLFLHDVEIFKDYIHVGTPVLINEFMWSSGASAIAMIMGRMGTEFVSANAINSVVMQLASVAIFGIGASASAIVGNTIGEGDYEKAQERSITLISMGALVGFMGSLLIFFLRPYVISVYNVSDLTKEYAYAFMTVTSFLVFFQAQSNVNMMGVLRGGGDGKYVMVLDVMFMWCISIPLGCVAGLFLGWPAPLVFFILKCDDILKSMISARRIISGKWVRNVTR